MRRGNACPSHAGVAGLRLAERLMLAKIYELGVAQRELHAVFEIVASPVTRLHLCVTMVGNELEDAVQFPGHTRQRVTGFA